MKKLTKDQIDEKDQLARRMDQAEADVREAIRIHNQRLDESWAEVADALDNRSQLVGVANAFLQHIHEEQMNYHGDRPDDWQDSIKGRAYGNWADEWDVALEEITIDCPGPIEEPEMDAAESLRDLAILPE